MKIAFFTARHSKTGVPLAQLRLAEALARRGHDVDFLVGYVPEGLAPPKSDHVRVEVFGRARNILMVPSMVRYLKREKPDIVFSAEDHMNAITAFSAIVSGSRAKISASSRMTPMAVYQNKRGLRPKIDALIHRVFRPRIDVLACVSSDMAGQYEEMFGGGRYEAVYNIVMDSNSYSRMAEPVHDDWFTDQSVPMIVAAGTLAKRKGFDVLIRAVAQVVKEQPVKLAILGEGYQREVLEKMIRDHGLEHKAKLLGLVENPLKYFSKSNVFVLSSYAEGLPNVLVEAMAAGCTVVSTDCPTGPAEVIRNGEYGYLVPMGNSEAMAAAIVRALRDPTPKEKLAEAVARFSEQAVISTHQRLLGF